MVIKPTSGVSNQVIEHFSAELNKKAYERVVKKLWTNVKGLQKI